MKSPILPSLFLFVAITAQTQNPTCQWAKGFGKAVLGGGQSMVTDGSGNVYATGYFIDTTLIFGNDTLVNPSSNFNQSMFLVKYDSSGNALWAKTANGGANATGFNDAGYGLGTDAGGNVYVIGSFESPVIIFGNDTLVSTNIYTFLVKYDPQGNALWAVNMGGTLNNADGIVVDDNGNSYISGYFTSGSIIGGTDTIAESGYIEAYVIKYDSSGNSLWAAGISGNNVFNYSIAVDAAANVYVTGGYSGDSAVAGNITLTNPNASGMYTVKYDAGGQVSWAQNVSVSGNIYPAGISTDAQGNVYVTGSTTTDTLVFGNDTAFTATSSAINNFFVAKYNNPGQAQWVRCTQNINNITSSGISATAGGNVYVTGTFNNNAIQIGSNSLTDNDTINQTQALFVAEYDATGNVIWTTGGLTAEDDIDGGVSIRADGKGHLYLAGNYAGPGVELGSYTLPFTGAIGSESNIFVARYSIPETGTGVVNTVDQSGILVYPNPSAGYFYFKNITGYSTLMVFNLLGQPVYSTAINGTDYTLNLSAQAKGIYFYQVVDANNKVYEGKIIVD